MEPINEAAFKVLADVRKTLVYARHHKQLHEMSLDFQAMRDKSIPPPPIPFERYDGNYAFTAKCLRLSARNIMKQLEVNAGIAYLLDLHFTGVAWLSDVPFREWPEYKQIFHPDGDTWSNPKK